MILGASGKHVVHIHTNMEAKHSNLKADRKDGIRAVTGEERDSWRAWSSWSSADPVTTATLKKLRLPQPALNTISTATNGKADTQ